MDSKQNFKMPARIGKNSCIQVEQTATHIYTSNNYRNVNETLLRSPAHWHMIRILHKPRRFEKKEVLSAFYSLIKEDLFTPFGFHQENWDTDHFFIFNQGNALKILFDNGLKIRIQQTELHLIVLLGVALITKGQPTVKDTIGSAILKKVASALVLNNSTLELSQFATSLDLEDFDISLSNKATLNLVCDQFNGIQKLKTSFSKFKFANNDIQFCEPFAKLHGVSMEVLDLRNNQIQTLDELQHLIHLNVEELCLTGNNCTNGMNYRDIVHAKLPSLKKVDGLSLKVASPSIPTIPFAFPVDTKKNLHRNLKLFNSGDGLGNDPITELDSNRVDITLSGGRKQKENIKHMKESFSSYRNDAMWSQIIIRHNNEFTKEDLMEQLSSTLFNNTAFFPCYFKRYQNRDEFYVYRNFDALRILMTNNLVFTLKSPSREENITIEIQLNASKFQDGQVDWFYKINHVLGKRIKNNVLDLNDFFDDEAFSHMLLPNTRFTFGHILEQTRRLNTQIVRINAQGNNIESLEGFQTITMFAKLVTLDLRKNRISSLDNMSATSGIKELMLDGNPFCEKFSDPYEYVTATKYCFDGLEWLDGHRIDENNKIILQNFIVKRDSYNVADEFVNTFFNIYDSFERQRLTQLYRDNSIFTLSVYYQASNQFNALYPRIRKYTDFSRDVSKLSDLTRACENVFYGSNCVMQVFTRLPKSVHNFRSFCIDVPSYSSRDGMVITVNGTFHEPGQFLNEDSLLLGFSRTFVLRPSINNDFYIANDQLFISSPTFLQRDEAAYAMPPISQENLRDLMPTEIEDKEMKLLLFQQLTELKTAECKRQLEESFWDIKVALATFNTLMDSGRDIMDDKFDFK